MPTPPIAEASQANSLLRTLSSFAANHGLGPTQPVVLAVGSNLVIHMAPAPVVARVANVTVASRTEPSDALAREVRLARHLVDHGFPTVAPSELLPPGPHQVDGWSVSFFTFAALSPVGAHHGAAVGEALHRLHLTAATMEPADGDPAPRTQQQEAETLLDRLCPRLDPSDAAVLRRAWEATRVEESRLGEPGQRQPLHGDPHRRNVGVDKNGQLIWFDLDDTMTDSTLIDLATLHRSWPEAGQAACRAAGVDPDSGLFHALLQQRETYVFLWIQLFGLERPNVHAQRAATEMAMLRQRWG